MTKTLAELKAEAEQKKQQFANNANIQNASTGGPVQLTKRYYNKIAGSRFIFGNGTEIHFLYGRADIGPDMIGGMDIYQHTNPDSKDSKNGLPCWKAYQKELDEILGRQTNIYIDGVLAPDAPVVPQNAKSDAEIAAADQLLKTGSNVQVQQEMGAFNGTGAPTDVNQSTVDPTLRAAMMGSAVNVDSAMLQGAASSTS